MLSVSRVHSNILKSERSTSTDFMIRSTKKLMVELSATVGLGLDSDVIQDVSSSTRISCGVHPARAHVSGCICDGDRDWRRHEEGGIQNVLQQSQVGYSAPVQYGAPVGAAHRLYAGCGEEGDGRLRLPPRFPVEAVTDPKWKPIDVGFLVT